MITTRISRNDPCPCRSGKKYKHCCLRAQPATFQNRVFTPPLPRHDNDTVTSLAPRQPVPRPAISTPLDKREWQEVHVTLDESTGDLVCAAIIYSREWLRSRNVVLGGPIQLCIPQYQVRGEGRVVAVKPSSEVPQGEGLVVACVRQKPQSEEAKLPPVKDRVWQQVHIRLDETDGKQVYVVMLHSREWLRLHKDLIVGGPVYLNLPQQGAHGEGRVIFVEPSPMISDGEGRVMTFVRSQRKANGEAKSAPMSSPLSRPGVRTYFGERMPPIGHEWVQLELKREGGLTSDLRLTRTTDWMRDNWHVVEELRKHQDERPSEIGQWRLVRVSVAVQESKKVHIALFWPLTWVQAHGLMTGEPVLLRLPKDNLFGEGQLTAIDPAPFVPRQVDPHGMMFISGQKQDGGKRTIASAEVGDYATTYTAEERGEPSLDDLNGEWVARQRVHLFMKKDDGSDVKIVLLRETEWVEAEGIEPGGSIYLNMPEQGTIGEAAVEAVDPVLVFKRANEAGVRMITGTFRHSESWAGDLKLKGESKPIGVTPGHLFWSEDRQDWVSVGDLKPGETVKTLKGTTTVESYTPADHPEPVYNLEVEHDHVYRVGDQGILVHNTSNPTAGTDYGCENKAGSGRLDPCESGLLATKLGGCKTDYQAHHLIACSVRNSVALKRAAELGFDINGKLNGWCLPSLECEAKSTGLPLHRGRHMSGSGDDPNYFACVKSLLNDLDAAYASGTVTDCNLCAKVASVAGKIRSALAAHQIWLQKADPNKGTTWQCPKYS